MEQRLKKDENKPDYNDKINTSKIEEKIGCSYYNILGILY